jgi:hypothetical protein
MHEKNATKTYKEVMCNAAERQASRARNKRDAMERERIFYSRVIAL